MTQDFVRYQIRDEKLKINEKDIELLRIGRHFIFDNNKVIVGRDEKENKLLMELKD